jgi:RIH domain
MSMDAEAANHLLSKSDVVQALLQDLIGFFSQPSLTLDHEERQLRLKALRNRQDLFQEEVGTVLCREISVRLNDLLRE